MLAFNYAPLWVCLAILVTIMAFCLFVWLIDEDVGLIAWLVPVVYLIAVGIGLGFVPDSFWTGEAEVTTTTIEENP